MSFSFSDYTKIKNNYCCCYLGDTLEYIVQLKLLRPSIEKQLKSINIFICCKDSHMYLLENEKNVIPISEMDKSKFGYIREFKFTGNHPILEFITESNLTIDPIYSQQISDGIGLICPEGIMPTKCLKDK